jgi:hypothetical protein
VIVQAGYLQPIGLSPPPRQAGDEGDQNSRGHDDGRGFGYEKSVLQHKFHHS